MKKKFVQIGLISMMLVIQGGTVFAREFTYAWDFSDCAVQDILYAVSLDSGISITADDTVTGKGSFKFSGNDFEKAFDSFLLASRLYVTKQKDLWVVSKVKIEKKDNLYSLDAFDVSPAVILEKLSEKFDEVVSYETLPASLVSVHLKNLNQAMLLQSFVNKFPEFFLEKTQNGFHIGKQVQYMTKTSNTENSDMKVELEQDGKIFIEAKNVKTVEVLEKLFCIAGSRQYCFLINQDNKISRCSFEATDFETALNTLCSQNGLKSINKDSIYYIVSETEAKDKLVSDNREWEKVSLVNVKADRFIASVSKNFGKLETIILPDNNSFLCLLSEKEKKEIYMLAEAYDVNPGIYVIELKYIKPDELLKRLPASFDKSNLLISTDNSSVYFTGTETTYKDLCRQIEICDRPSTRISYDILILQYDESSDNSWSSNVKAERLGAGEFSNLSLGMGSILNLNFDVITTFGLKFAQSLQASIENDNTKVYADTTLHGISGKQINFQNTNTYRYRDNNLDPETGKPVYSGITREITSGLKLEITGWVSGNGMITSTVTASVTRQGTDTSSLTGNPPPTTEKLVTTEVCGKNGEPIVLSGLIQNSESFYEKGVPGISKIPVAGAPFKSRNKASQHTQMIIYLVPHVDDYGSIFLKKPEVYNREWAKNKLEKLNAKWSQKYGEI